MKLNVLFITLLIGLCLAVAPSGAVSVYLQNGMQLTTYITTPATPDTNSMSRVVVDGDVYDFGRSDGTTTYSGKLLGRVSCSNYSKGDFAGLTGAGTTRSGIITRFTMPFQYPFNTPADNFVRWYRIANRGANLTGLTMAFAFNTSEQDGVVQPFAMKRWYASAWTDYNNGAGGDTGADGDVDIVNATIPGSGSATPAVSDWIYVHYQASLATLYMKVLLEGPYSLTTHKMGTALRNDPGAVAKFPATGFIPVTSPYSADPTTSLGDPNNVPTNITDWVLIETRTVRNDPATSSYKAGLLMEDGRVADPANYQFGLQLKIPDGDYYVIVKHRNHEGIVSANLVNTASTVTTPYDFTTGENKYYVIPDPLNPNPKFQKIIGATKVETIGMQEVWAMIPCDASSVTSGTQDGYVDTQDNTYLLAQMVLCPYCPDLGQGKFYTSADFNMNAQAETNDGLLYLLKIGYRGPFGVPYSVWP